MTKHEHEHVKDGALDGLLVSVFRRTEGFYFHRGVVGRREMRDCAGQSQIRNGVTPVDWIRSRASHAGVPRHGE